MTDEPSQAEVNRWRDAITEDEWIPKYELSQMGKRDPMRFAHLCRALLSDPSPVVQRSRSKSCGSAATLTTRRNKRWPLPARPARRPFVSQ